MWPSLLTARAIAEGTMRFFIAVGACCLFTPFFTPAADPDRDARKKAAEVRYVKLKDYCKERRVTHIVELLAEWGEFADEKQQDEVSEMVAALREEKEVKTILGTAGPQVGYRGVSATTKVKKLWSDATSYFVDEFVSVQSPNCPDPAENCANKHMLIASRKLTIRPNQRAEECIVLTNAPVAEFQGLDKCIVLSSGSVSVSMQVTQSVVVCRGDIQYWTREEETALVRVGGKLTDTVTVESGGKQPAPLPDKERVFQGDKTLLGVKFYSVVEDGLEVTAEKGVVSVAKVDEKKPFAKAGIQKGDVIVSVNGEKVPNLHELDRLICRATVASGTAKVQVERKNKSETLDVKLVEWK